MNIALGVLALEGNPLIVIIDWSLLNMTVFTYYFFWGGGLFGVWFVGGVGSKKSYFPHFCSVGVEDESGEAASQNRRCDRGSAGIVFVGGFSYADVLDSAKGWAGSIRRNPALWASFLRFYHRFVSGRGPLLDYFPSLPPTPIHKIILHLMLALSVPHCRSFQPPLPVPQPRLPVPSTPFTGPPNPLCRSPQTPLPVPPTPFAGPPNPLCRFPNLPCRSPQPPLPAPPNPIPGPRNMREILKRCVQ